MEARFRDGVLTVNPLDVQGEEIRKDITNGEAGVPVTLAIQVVDYRTCQTVPNAYVDIWSSNATVSDTARD